MKPVRFHVQAKAEIAHEVVFYKSVSPALAQRFVKAVEDSVELASEFPAMGAVYRDGTRRCFTRSFPFAVVYLERETELLVLALAPFSRKPGYWRARLKDG